MGPESTIERLNSFLRGEISAVETYQMALGKIDHISTVRDELLVNLKSHEDRIMMLQDAIRELDGEPALTSGPWGALAKTVEKSATVLGEKAAVAALEEGEDHGLADYQQDLDELGDRERQLVTDRLLPAQQRTHDRLSDLKKRL
jgi:demethoxyubiquinone hydroxylase (CLK1/Coq7/Cat5 family)